MSLIKTLLYEAVAQRRKKQALIRIAKVLFKSYSKEFYNEVRDYIQTKQGVSKNKYLKTFSKIKSTYAQTDSFGEFFDRIGFPENPEIGWALVYSYYATIRNADPTDNGQYINWLITAWLSPEYWNHFKRVDEFKYKKSLMGVILEQSFYERFSEDIVKIRSNIVKFEKAKELNSIEGEEADINNYKDTKELFDKVKELESDPEILRSKREKVQDDSEVIYEDNNFKIIIPRSHEASCAWGTGTNWCTTIDDDPQTYERYMEEGDLIMFIGKSVDRKFQAHWQSGEKYWFMNERDEFALEEFEEIVGRDLFEKYVGIIIYWTYKEMPNKIDMLAEFNTFVDETHYYKLKNNYYEPDFLGDEVLKAMNKDLINIIEKHSDKYTQLAEEILSFVKDGELPYKSSGRTPLQDKWIIILEKSKRRVINDVFFEHEAEAKYTDKAIEEYFEGMLK